MIKLIDAKDNLSIQVHPDNEYAQKVEHEFGKTEIWYVLDAEPDATLIYGFKEKISADEFKNAIESNTLLDVLNVVNVKKVIYSLLRQALCTQSAKVRLLPKFSRTAIPHTVFTITAEWEMTANRENCT